jgi:hypothetical protein
MTTRKIIIYSLVTYIAIGVILMQSISGRKLIGIFDILSISLFTCIIWIVGLFVGRIISVLYSNALKNKRYYAIGQIIAITLFVSIYFYYILTEKSDSISKSNRAFAGMTSDDIWNPKNNQTQKAFIKLESSFKDPNEIKLEEWFTVKRDSIIGLDTLNYTDIHFIYRRNNSKYFAVVESFHENLTVKKINENPRNDNFYKTIDSASKKNIKDVKDALKKIPDSTKNKISNYLSE